MKRWHKRKSQAERGTCSLKKSAPEFFPLDTIAIEEPPTSARFFTHSESSGAKCTPLFFFQIIFEKLP